MRPPHELQQILVERLDANRQAVRARRGVALEPRPIDERGAPTDIRSDRAGIRGLMHDRVPRAFDACGSHHRVGVRHTAEVDERHEHEEQDRRGERELNGRATAFGAEARPQGPEVRTRGKMEAARSVTVGRPKRAATRPVRSRSVYVESTRAMSPAGSVV